MQFAATDSEIIVSVFAYDGGIEALATAAATIFFPGLIENIITGLEAL
jgi:hypothetical protein